MILPYQDKRPLLGKNVYIAEGARIIGSTTIGDFSSVWFNCVLRGDIDTITIGQRTNIQDSTVIHVNAGQPTIIEDDVSVGHSCILHGCIVRRGSLIGMGSIILNDAEIGENSLVGAGSLILERKKFPPNSLLLGRPAKIVRELTPEELEFISKTSRNYLNRAQEYLKKFSTPLLTFPL